MLSLSPHTAKESVRSFLSFCLGTARTEAAIQLTTIDSRTIVRFVPDDDSDVHIVVRRGPAELSGHGSASQQLHHKSYVRIIYFINGWAPGICDSIHTRVIIGWAPGIGDSIHAHVIIENANSSHYCYRMATGRSGLLHYISP